MTQNTFVAIDGMEFHSIVLAIAMKLVNTDLPERPPTP
jgi:hypothetical protein